MDFILGGIRIAMDVGKHVRLYIGSVRRKDRDGVDMRDFYFFADRSSCKVVFIAFLRCSKGYPSYVSPAFQIEYACFLNDIGGLGVAACVANRQAGRGLSRQGYTFAFREYGECLIPYDALLRLVYGQAASCIRKLVVVGFSSGYGDGVAASKRGLSGGAGKYVPGIKPPPAGILSRREEARPCW